MRFILSWVTSILFNAIALYAVAQLFSSFYLADFGTALLASLIIFILNVFVRPILVIFTLPATILTLGLFLFVINAITLMITQAVMSSDFVISNFVLLLLQRLLFQLLMLY